MNISAKWLLNTFLFFYYFHTSISIDTITSSQPIKDGEVIVSGGKTFALGFFSLANPVKRYVGIWYNQISEQTIVWVANRDNPISDKSGVLSVNTDGNLALYGRNQTVLVWQTNISDPPAENTIAQLLDSGNLVLVRNDSRETLWQSFDHPTNTLLPNMKLGLDKRTGHSIFLTSWKSPDDPGTGNCSFRIDPSGFSQLILYKGAIKWWRTGSWTGKRWSGVPEMTTNYILNASFVDNQDEVFISYGVINPSVLSRTILNESGNEQRSTWSNREHKWIWFFGTPEEQCDFYGHCGPNSNCDPFQKDKFECSCLPGFEPKYPQEWYLRDGSGGCKRKRGFSTCQGGEGFVRLTDVKVPDTSVAHVDMSLGLEACKDKCLRNCSCLAYTSAYAESNGGNGCLTYHGDMMDTRIYANAGQDFYIRVDAAELALYAKNGSLGKKKILAVVIVFSVAMLLMVALACWLFRRCSDFRRKRSIEKATNSRFSFSFSERSSYLDNSLSGKEQDWGRKNSDLPLPVFDPSTIAAATNNFSSDSKLGEGGFGSVYKGQLHGKEIAVKRLSKFSGQGIGEFKNEISLIAKLQHRNLVSILGCCIDAQEKMIIYEYLPNKSLDFFIFDETKRSLLDWGKRFEIICGIAKGILYLHHDSRLRIIHRDLKASNVLLDAEMNPKISDFGLARIFGGDQIEANTNRVVGTYGYMSPEYAMEGLFSIKSDVYSFGVLLLEIITGRKNSAFSIEEGGSCSNLVGHVWDLWREDRSMQIVDKSLGKSYPDNEVSRCIQIGLLCVQEHATERPSMSTVLFMLRNDNDLPSPKQPAFILKRASNVDGIWSSGGVSCLANDITITSLQGR